MDAKLLKPYDPAKTEGRIYELWLQSGLFNPDNLPGGRDNPYVILIAPPNITGELHIGHALENVIADALTRFQRMRGLRTLWLPGTDHAGIATQVRVEKEIRKQGLSRQKLGRDKFVAEIWRWRERYGQLILNQLKELGCSLDWSRTRFTMDRQYQETVRQAFLHYSRKGWIYQGERTINWCPKCATSLSDLEVDYRDEETEWFEIRYGPLTVGTVRPETTLGDTAVAVNPTDSRYQNLIGREIEIETAVGPAKLKVIGDPKVDPAFSTGAMKVTPAHDLHDFELSEEYQLEKKQVIGPDGKMTALAGKYAGLTPTEARQTIVKDLEQKGLLADRRPYRHNVAVCARCNHVIEPLLSKQWFLKMGPLAASAIKAVETDRVKYEPERFKAIALEWLKNVRDWCISRQIWWGHPIPGSKDVLDTWFSAALWPLAVLGWPEKNSPDRQKFYPTDLITSSRDILHLWIARMIFTGLELAGEVPFKQVLVHPTVLTAEGRRMSKSLGIGDDPSVLIGRYGADAVRFGLLYQIFGGQDIRFQEANIQMGKKFANKIWNVARYVLSRTGENFCHELPAGLDFKDAADREILSRLQTLIKEVDAALKEFQFGPAAHLLYDFIWRQLADRYLEDSKNRHGREGNVVLSYTLTTLLKLLHPFMPFISEELWSLLPPRPQKNLLLIEPWPHSA